MKIGRLYQVLGTIVILTWVQVMMLMRVCRPVQNVFRIANGGDIRPVHVCGVNRPVHGWVNRSDRGDEGDFIRK